MALIKGSAAPDPFDDDYVAPAPTVPTGVSRQTPQRTGLAAPSVAAAVRTVPAPSHPTAVKGFDSGAARPDAGRLDPTGEARSPFGSAPPSEPVARVTRSTPPGTATWRNTRTTTQSAGMKRAAASASSAHLTTISGTVTRVIHKSAGFHILLLDGRTKLLGNAAAEVKEGMVITCKAAPQDYKGERQYKTDYIEEVTPFNSDDLVGIEAYLGRGDIDGVGKVIAKELVARFGKDVFNIILNHRDRLLAIPGLGPNRISKIVVSVRQKSELHGAMSFLAGHGIGPGIGARVVAHFETDVRKKIEENPYLLTEVSLVGFSTADGVARSLGMPPDSMHRIRSAIEYCLNEATNNGNTMIPASQVVDEAKKLLGIHGDLVFEGVRKMATEMDHIIMRSLDGRAVAPNALEFNQAFLSPRKLFYAERQISHDVKRIMGAERTRRVFEPGKEAEQAETFESFRKLDDTQKAAVLMALTSNFSVITGGPGVGKSTSQAAVVDIAKASGLKVMLASPTGRAARRLAEATGEEAHTIHHLLKPSDQGFRKGVDDPLDADLLIVDEHGMTDTLLQRHLLRAVATGASVLFVGDADQLPSVGPGSVLRDFLVSGVVPVSKLTKPHRFAEASAIIQSAHQVIAGNMPVLTRKDCMFLKRETEAVALDALLGTVQSLIRRGEYKAEQIQVLTPQHRGDVGTENLNTRLRDMINPDTGQPSVKVIDRVFRKGDRVIQLKNEKAIEISNGDLGHIRKIDDVAKLVTVDFGGRSVSMGFAQMNNLALAYAITIHKSQGSEFPVVVMPIMESHIHMLNRNLVYTAMTRGKERVVMVGEPRALLIAVKKADAEGRTTGLSGALRRWIQDGEDIAPKALREKVFASSATQVEPPSVMPHIPDDELKNRVFMKDPFDFDRMPSEAEARQIRRAPPTR